MQAETSCHLCCTWGHLAGWLLLLWGLCPFERFWGSAAWAEAWACMAVAGRRLSQLGGPGSQGITGAGWTVLARLMGSSDLVSVLYPLDGRRVPQRNNSACHHFILERVVPIPAPPALALKLINLVSPYMILVLFELLPLFWSLEKVSLWEWVCGLALWDLQVPLCLAALYLVKIPAGFHSQVFWGLLFLSLKPGSGSPVWGWDTSFLRGTSAAKITVPILSHHTVVLGLACSMSPSLLPALISFFFISSVIGILFSCSGCFIYGYKSCKKFSL